MKVIWDEEALRGLNDLYDYSQELSPQGAKKLYNDILDEADRLATFPNIAKVEPLLSGYPLTYRSLVVRKNCKLIYFIDEENEAVVIVRLWDCRQDPARLRIEH